VGRTAIHGELLMLGIEVAESTVGRYMVRRRRPPSQGWKTFLRNHAAGIAHRPGATGANLMTSHGARRKLNSKSLTDLERALRLALNEKIAVLNAIEGALDFPFN
jgi:hypothetical protein